jgi:hypothetical protein
LPGKGWGVFILSAVFENIRNAKFCISDTFGLPGSRKGCKPGTYDQSDLLTVLIIFPDRIQQ